MQNIRLIMDISIDMFTLVCEINVVGGFSSNSKTNVFLLRIGSIMGTS